MKKENGNAEKSVEEAIDNALNRLFVLHGKDRLAVISEYKEWIGSESVNDEVLVLRTGTQD